MTGKHLQTPWNYNSADKQTNNTKKLILNSTVDNVVQRTRDWLAAIFHITDLWGLITKPNHSQDNVLIKLSDLLKSGVRLLLDLRSKAGLGTDTEPNTPWWRLEGCFHGETHLDLQRRSRRWWIINLRRALTLAQSGWRLTPALPCRLPCNK